MELTRVRVTDYKSIDDSGWVKIGNVTCLVGKNESGKTAFLSALKRLNPVAGVDGSFDLKDYPRKGYARYKRRHKTQPAVAVRAEFRLSNEEIREIEDDFGPGSMESPHVIVMKDYGNARHWEIEVNERAVVRHLCAKAGLPSEIEAPVEAATTCEELVSILEKLEIKPPVVEDLLIDVANRFKTGVKEQIISGYLEKLLPTFVYFDDYSTMRGRISIQDIQSRCDNGDPLDEADRTFLSLISLVGADLDDFQNEMDYEHLKAELESASIGITDDVFEYWCQNRQLRVEFSLSNANPNDPPPLNEGTILHVRIWNNRHRVSVPFDERSKGFVWFFSFLAYFSGLETEDENASMVLLLDEPGLNLHAMGQNDFLRFIDERLAPKHQVVYTTHSPFMIDLTQLGTVRTVQDVDDKGTVITDDVVAHDKETVFPIQVALGYRLAQSLFLAPHCLLVNAPSDQLYLQVLGEAVSAKGRARIDPRWVVIPVGGADNLPTYLSLLGDGHVNVAIMMDVTPKSKKHIDQTNQNAQGRRNPIRMVEVTRVRDADMEDLFDPQFYLKLVNQSYGADLPCDLTMRAISDPNPRIVKRIQSYFEKEGIGGGCFDPYRPAAYLLQGHLRLRDELDDGTIDRAASLFERINDLLPSNGHGSPADAANAGAATGRSWSVAGDRSTRASVL